MSFIEAAVIYRSLVFLPVPAIRRGGSDRLKLEVVPRRRGTRRRTERGSNRTSLSERVWLFKVAGELGVFFLSLPLSFFFFFKQGERFTEENSGTEPVTKSSRS